MKGDFLATQTSEGSQLKTPSAEEKWRAGLVLVESIIDAIILDVREPEPWEAIYIAHALHALAEGRFDAANTFAQCALSIKPGGERPPSLSQTAAQVRLADIELALGLLKARGAPYPVPRRRSRSSVWTAIEKSRRRGPTADLWEATDFL